MTEEPPEVLEAHGASGSSIWARITNVFATPVDVFDEVIRSKPTISNWLVPALLSSVTGIVFTLIVFAQPNVQQELREAQERQFDKLVAAGKMSAEERDRSLASMATFGITMTKIAGAAGSIVGSFAWPFVIAAVLLVLGKTALSGRFSFMKAAEVAGLAGMIQFAGTLVQMLLVLVMNSLHVSAGPVLLFRDLDPQTKLYGILSSINFPMLWYVGVVACGLSRLSGVAFLKPALWLFGLWAVWRLAIVFAGLAASGM